MYEHEGMPPPACPMCMQLRNEQFYIVRELVREFPGITALQVNQATEVPMEIILRFVEMGMIEVMPTANRDGKLDERIGLMVKKAKEMRAFYQEHEGTKGSKLDELLPGAEPEADTGTFTWLDEEGHKQGSTPSEN